MKRLICCSVTVLIFSAAVAEEKFEAPVDPFLGESRFEMQQVFKDERFPNIVVGKDGTLVVSWGSQKIRTRRSVDGGETWEAEVVVADPGFHGGGAIADERSGDLLVFVEEKHPPSPFAMYRSKDGGKTWAKETPSIAPDPNGNVPSLHMNEAGITLRRGSHAGRLIRASRFYAGGNKREEYPNHYTNAIFSDDGGKSWRASAPFPENGTGEAALVELSDGRIYYNSRLHWPDADKPTRRRCAWSFDGGMTWEDWRIVDVLPDGVQDNAYGCMGGLVRLPIEGQDILIYSNLDVDEGPRRNVTVWASFDGGKTWPIKRAVFDGRSAYSSLTAGRPDTPSEGWIYLHFEGGPGGGSHVARFNLAWILEGEATGDGQPPE